MAHEQRLNNGESKGEPKGSSTVDTLLSLRYAALTGGGATLAAFLYYRQNTAPRGSDEDKDDKSSRVNAKSGGGSAGHKIEACDEFCLHGEGQNKI